MNDDNRISFSDLFIDWKVKGKYFYFKKNRSWFRTPQKTLNKKQQSVQINEKRKVNIIYKVMGKVFHVIALFCELISLIIVPSGKVLILNHSARKRNGEQEISPLYLTSQNFNYDNMVVIEDEFSDFTYSKKSKILNRENIIAGSSIISVVLNFFFRKRDKDIAIFISQFYMWKLLLRLLKPKKVMFFVWYGGKEPLIAACKELNIESIELQHGIMYPSHPCYNIHEGKKFLHSELLLPDRCLVYGEYWKHNLVKSGWESAKIDVVGYFLNISQFQKVEISKPYILYATSSHIRDAVIKHIHSIEKEAQKRGWQILLTIHPSDSVESYQDIISENVTITSVDAYDAIRDCAAIIGMSSTLLWEAMLFDKPAFIIEYGFEASDLLDDLIRYEYARTLTLGEFPEPFSLPLEPKKTFFFASKIDKSLLT